MNKNTLSMPVKVKPYAHQQNAFDFVCALFGLTTFEETSSGAALLMEMGTGKSLVGLAVAGILSRFSLIERVLVVCPLSIMGVWEEELAKFGDFPYTVTLLKGTMAKKKEQLANLPRSELQIVVTNYETMWRMEAELQRFHAGLIIADEGHRLKDGTSRQSKAMHRLGDRADYRLLLTGTAISNKELDIYSEYRFAAPQVFGKSFYAFRGRYFYMGGYGGYVPQFKKEMLDDFLERLHSVAFRVRKDECLDLPPVTEEVRTVDLEPKAAKLYAQIEEESYAAFRDSEVTVFNVLTQILRLSQITGGHLTDDDKASHAVSTAKLDALADIIETMQEEGEKLVIMARFVPELDDIEALLQKKKIGYACVRGGVKDRAEEVRRFQEDSDCRIFLGKIQAAGMGLTLTAASTMVFFSLDYNMANFDQAKARIHRVSQTRNCHYIYLCCKDTIASPGDHYIPHSSSGQYSQPPWGRIEKREFSGTEYLITPACALSGAIPGSGGYSYGSWSYGTGIYEKYAGRRIGIGNRGVWRYIMQRTVHSTTTHIVQRSWESDTVVTKDYTIRARRTNNPYTDISDAFFKGMYANCGMIASSFPIKRSNEYGYLSLGMTYRSENDPGEDGIFLMTDMGHYGSGNDVFYAGSHSFYGCPPGDIGQHDRGFSVEAPMFSGHKHFDCYDSGWNVGRQDITSWEDPRMDEWSHTDLNGSFTILENNNPSFASISDYVNAFIG